MRSGRLFLLCSAVGGRRYIFICAYLPSEWQLLVISVALQSHTPHLDGWTLLNAVTSRESIERTHLMAGMEHKLYKHEIIVESCLQSDFRHWLSSNFRAMEETPLQDMKILFRYDMNHVGTD